MPTITFYDDIEIYFCSKCHKFYFMGNDGTEHNISEIRTIKNGYYSIMNQLCINCEPKPVNYMPVDSYFKKEAK